MAKNCCEVPKHLEPNRPNDSVFLKALWIALILNFAMFFVEALASFRADSVSLLADAVDFLGDAGNYAISLIVLPLAIQWRSRAALIKGGTMLVYGLFVVSRTIWMNFFGDLPHAETMGWVGLSALSVNLLVALMLFQFRSGDANQKSVWICSRNDAIGNVAVLGAAGLVALTSKQWPDLIVALGIAGLAIQGGWTVTKEALQELRTPIREPHPHGG